MLTYGVYRQATQEQTEDPQRYGQGQGCQQEEGQIDDSLFLWFMVVVAIGVAGTGGQAMFCTPSYHA